MYSWSVEGGFPIERGTGITLVNWEDSVTKR